MPSIPIIDQLVHPSFGLLNRNFLGVFADQVQLVPPQGLGSLTYGVSWDFFTLVNGLGYRVGQPNVYVEPIVQVASVYQLLDGHQVTTQVEFGHWDGGLYFWDEPLPLQVLVTVFPFCEVALFWLQT